MARGVVLAGLYVLAGWAAYLLLGLGEYVATGLKPNSLTINAFLFLVGLSGALTLLSPTHTSRRFHSTHTYRRLR